LQDSFIIAEGAYHPKPWSGRAVLFRARQESALGAWTAYVVDEQHGWGRFLQGGVEIVVCAGDHATMCEEPHVRDLARKLRGQLDAVPVQRAPDVDAAPATSKSHAGE
jgi:thioesterase domain-containing protein